MSIVGWLRKTLSGINLPIWAGQVIAAIPYGIRPGLGSKYRKSANLIRDFEDVDSQWKKDWIFRRIKGLVQYAEEKIPFYADHYRKNGFESASLKEFADIERIPPITKSLLLNYDLKDRSNLDKSGYLVNTGGTSGTTLDLYIHPGHIGNEWAHMHQIWGQRGFHPRDLKLMLTGRSEFKDGLHYDILRHSLSISVYAEIDQLATQLMAVIKRYQPRFIHGYPSALYEFALSCQKKYPELLSLLNRSLTAGFLGSEFPIELYRVTAEELLGISTISWYGHTERCILAYEKTEPFHYSPFQSYGYTEVVENEAGEPTLMGTSYYNLSSPLIRYDTEDQVLDYENRDGLLTGFRIKEGRKGEFVLDANGKKIPLTGLIFGRHHELFNYCSHIQIYQKGPGFASVLYVPLDQEEIPDPAGLFDSKNVNLQFDYIMLTEPVRTSRGKVKLVVEDDSFLRNSE